MARQNQGLQAALIVFVVLTVLLGVLTFVFSNQASTAKMRADEAEEKARSLNEATLTIQDENNRLKQLMGFPETMKFDEISTEVEDDLNTYAANFQGETRGYHQVVAFLFQTIQDKMGTVADLEEQLQQIKDKIPMIEEGARTQIAQHEKRAQAAEQAQTQTTSQYKQTQEKLASATEEATQLLSDIRTKTGEKVQDYEAQLSQRGERIQELTDTARKAIDRLKQVESKSFEVPDGQVQWVDHRNQKVWINLGRADALPNQISFAVYPADVTAPSEEEVKGSIEVQQITGDKLAEARIINDSASDPIMPGDKIHTPIWAPGEQRRFALAGKFDINDDGRSDLDLVKRIITMNGGKIDAYPGPEGTVEGQVTLKTRFLVLGDPPTGPVASGDTESYSDLQRQAASLGVDMIPVEELLGMMGYRPRAIVAQFGEGSGIGPARYRERERLTEGAAETSGGTVSGLFRERRPPRPRPGGAY